MGREELKKYLEEQNYYVEKMGELFYRALIDKLIEIDEFCAEAVAESLEETEKEPKEEEIEKAIEECIIETKKEFIKENTEYMQWLQKEFNVKIQPEIDETGATIKFYIIF